MFLSRRRSLAFPQSEHARLAGQLACLWGNEQFKAPGESPSDEISFSSFCTGVALHDAGYGPIDNDAIGKMSRAASRRRFIRLMDLELDDRVAETIVLHHVRRLINHTDFSDLQLSCNNRLNSLIIATGVSAGCYERLDTITNLCDSIAFQFCFEAPAEGTVKVVSCPASPETIPIHFRYDGESLVTVDPWPFSVAEIVGYMIAYQTPMYPSRLHPSMVPYRVIAV